MVWGDQLSWISNSQCPNLRSKNSNKYFSTISVNKCLHYKLGYYPTIINNGHEIQVLTWFMLAQWRSPMTHNSKSAVLNLFQSHLSAGSSQGLVVFRAKTVVPWVSLEGEWVTALGCSLTAFQFRWSLFGTQVNREHKSDSLSKSSPTYMIATNQQTFHLYKFDLYL